MTIALPSTPAAPATATATTAATSAAGAPIAANPLAAATDVGDASKSAQDAQQNAAGASADVNRFLQALQRAGTSAAWTLGSAAGAATLSASNEVAVEDATDNADAPAALPLPGFWMAALVTAPASSTAPATNADATPLAGQDGAAPLAGLAAGQTGLALPAAPSAFTTPQAGTVAAAATLPAGVPAQPFSAANQPVATDANAAPAQPAAALHAQPGNGAAAALTGGSALSPEAAAVRERSTATIASHRAAATTDAAAAMAANTFSSDATGPTALQTPAHAMHAATRAPSAWVDALGERIEMQLQRGSERAVIRLDPPMQGQLEITVRRDAGVIQVHLSATSADVVKQLQAISDSLRQDLGTRQAGDVSVVVSQHSARDGDGRGRHSAQTPEQTEPGRALAEAQDDQNPARFALSTPTY